MAELPEGAPDRLVDAERVRVLHQRGEQQVERFARLARGRQVARLVARGMSEVDARQRLAAQWPTSKKAERAEFVIATDGSFAETDGQIERVLRALRASNP